MKGRRHTPEQIVGKLHDADRLIAEGKSMAVVLKHLRVVEQTYYAFDLFVHDLKLRQGFVGVRGGPLSGRVGSALLR